MATDAFAVALALAGAGPVVLLDGDGSDGLGRWSYVGVEPVGAVAAWGERLVHWQRGGQRRERGDPLAALARRVAELPQRPAGEAPLQCGAIGYIGYELGRTIECLPTPADDRQRMPDLLFWLFDQVLAFDGQEQRWHGSAGLVAKADAVRPLPPPPGSPGHTLSVDHDGARHLRSVAALREHIAAGDVYQVNLARRFRTVLQEPPRVLYQRLRERRPAPLGAYFESHRHAVLSNSPELFLEIAGGRVSSRPIKGTRRRGDDRALDQALRTELLSSVKDEAELTMIVDLVRNDLGKVATPGSVCVPTLKELVSLPTLHHLVATVEAQKAADVTAIDVIRAAFPAGSITGCPKIRAMELIAAYEGTRRGVYTGAIGWLGRDGSLQLNVAIRTMSVTGREATFHAGGGIVFDSEPLAELAETEAKAVAFLEALGVRR